ncbi:MAG: type IV pilus assembly protein PilM [Candidatus Yanofskybacteria bacterium]|nr:type IV pilus assembly protein PilM [Candidatus Yanofskybacteria bacterium]
MFDALTLHPTAFGLDISDLSLKIAYLKPQGKGFQLQSFGNFPIAEGIVERGEIKQGDALAQAIKKAVQSLGTKLPTRHVVASLPEEQAFLQVMQLPRMKKEELEHAVRFEAENYVPHAIEKVYLDFQVVHPFHNHLDHMDVLLAALPKIVVDPYLDVLERSGLSPKALEIESLAISRALIPKETAPMPLLLVDFGASHTSFVVFSGYSLRFTASIPVSSRQLTYSIARSMNIKEDEAEELKVNYGLDRQDEEKGKAVSDALLVPLADFAEQIKKHLSYYESHTAHQHMGTNQQRIKRIILSGGGANLKGFPRFLAKQLEREVVLGNPWGNILETSLKELPPLPFGESLKYTAALGLALRGQNND